jgi:hypothetical protein
LVSVLNPLLFTKLEAAAVVFCFPFLTALTPKVFFASTGFGFWSSLNSESSLLSSAALVSLSLNLFKFVLNT